MCALTLPADHLASTSTFKASDWRVTVSQGSGNSRARLSSPHSLRLIFSTNHYPQSKDASHAFFRRWLVVPFDAVIDPRVSGYQTSRQGSLKLMNYLGSSIERLRYSLA
jgi:hypothetical protein